MRSTGGTLVIAGPTSTIAEASRGGRSKNWTWTEGTAKLDIDTHSFAAHLNFEICFIILKLLGDEFQILLAAYSMCLSPYLFIGFVSSVLFKARVWERVLCVSFVTFSAVVQVSVRNYEKCKIVHLLAIARNCQLVLFFTQLFAHLSSKAGHLKSQRQMWATEWVLRTQMVVIAGNCLIALVQLRAQRLRSIKAL